MNLIRNFFSKINKEQMTMTKLSSSKEVTDLSRVCELR